jgi:hypothetical protein
MMKKLVAAALALTIAAPLAAQAGLVDFSVATPLPGRWSFVPSATGGDAVFADTAGRPQLTLRCTRATRRVSMLKPASTAATAITVWTTSTGRSVASAFNPATATINAEFAATDPLLDAIGFSRGRFAVAVAGAPALVLPSWPEVSRVVEECRT